MERKALIPGLRLNSVDLDTPKDYFTPVAISTAFKSHRSSKSDDVKSRKFFPSISDSDLNNIPSKLQKYPSVILQ